MSSFESSVVLDSSQANEHDVVNIYLFESSVVLDSSQADCTEQINISWFESSVVLDSSQAVFPLFIDTVSLRVV